MDNIVFNPDQDVYQRTHRPESGGGLLGWFMKWAGISDEQAANGVLLLVAIVFLVLAGVIFFWYR